LQFANGRDQPSAYANSKKGDDGTSVRLVFLTTNATQGHRLKSLSNLIPRSRCCATAAIVLLLHGVGPSGQSGRARVIEATLKKMFAEAGCDDQQVSAKAHVLDEVAVATAAADSR
jgi:hypothetical protein